MLAIDYCLKYDIVLKLKQELKMDQKALEDKGTGFRCRGCGISVMGKHQHTDEKLCTACLSPYSLHQILKGDIKDDNR